MADCPKCGKSFVYSENYCGNCGVTLRTKCTKCGQEIWINKKYCSECGTPNPIYHESKIKS